MSEYSAPLADMRFAATRLADFDDVLALPGHEELDRHLLDAIFQEAGRFAAGVLAPLNRIGDLEGSRLENGIVRTPNGWAEAYRAFVAGGWNAVPFSPDYGGQGLPWLIGTVLQEMWHSANMAFSLCPMLTQAAVEALSLHGSSALKARFLPKMVSGDWTGTMNLTEPQAGSDLAAIRTRAVQENGHYRITGQKIFITYGDHDLSENIIHLVLARLPGGPHGVKGISLFLVPKFVLDEDGSPSRPNDLRCISLEHKMGVHASPTAVLSYGEDGGAIGYLVGEANKGLSYMFTTMNNARLSVGVQGVGVAERALQKAARYARERVQGRDSSSDDTKPVAIIRHPDVRRMLLTMRALTEAGRALAYYAAGKLDVAGRHPDKAARAQAQAVADLLIPVVKGWGTEIGSEAASLGVQVHGGTGYVEETGAAQYMRDAKIAEIYEGTNGIQANDLVGRKLARDGGKAAKTFIATMRGLDFDGASDELFPLGQGLALGLDRLEQATDWIVAAHGAGERQAAAAGAVPYLRLWGTVAGGWLMAKAALAARADLNESDAGFLRAKIITARFYGEHILPRALSYSAAAIAGAASLMAMPDEAL